MSELLLVVRLRRSRTSASALKGYYASLACEAEELSPALQRWVVSTQVPSAVGTAEQESCAVPTGLGVIYDTLPALKRWAKLFRACGARYDVIRRFLINAIGSRTVAIKQPAALGSGMQSRRPPFFTFQQRTANLGLVQP